MPFVSKLNQLIKQPAFHVVLLMLLLSTTLLFSTPHPLDDSTHYQSFAEKLVIQGQLDFSIPGFHGPSFFVAIIYFITRSSISVIIFESLASVLSVWLTYLAARQIFNDQFKGLLAAYIYSLMPFINLAVLRGWTWASTYFFTLLTIYLVFKKSNWSGFAWGLAIITKVLPVTLLPFFIYKKKYGQALIGLSISALYALLVFLQTGRLMIGVHPDISAQSLFSLSRLPLNAIFAFQSYFSLHNFTPFNPTYYGDMIHFSVFVTFFALLGLAYSKKYFSQPKLFITLFSTAVFSFLVPASFFYFDRYYFMIFDVSLILLALPVISRYQLLFPLIAFSFSYQFFYFYLSYQEHFWPAGSYLVYLTPAVIFIISLIYVFYNRKQIFTYASR